ncbi:MAG TPA: hypothetical protein VIK99_00630 [Thermaerobacter sp.]
MRPLTRSRRERLHDVGVTLVLLGGSVADSQALWIPVGIVVTGIAVLAWAQRARDRETAEGVEDRAP